MPLTVVSLAYPFVPVGFDTVGGTEQVVAHLDEMLVRGGHRSIVVACEGSRIAGTLAATPPLPTSGPVDQSTWDWAYEVHRQTLREVLATNDVDVLHLHGVDFHKYLQDSGPATLATLHLPPHNYPDQVWRASRSLQMVSCVSRYSRRQYPPQAPMALVTCGVSLDQFHPGPAKEDFIVALGRISPEKGFHLALDAARQAGLPLLLAGRVPPFPEAERYFEEEIRPRLDADRRFLGSVALADRADLLARARCLAVPSLVHETGPLVAMEALASGTPVVAFPVGAVPDNIEHGRTGLLVNGVEEMARAFERAAWLDPRECRRAACKRFAAERMGRDYLELYHALAAIGRNDSVAA
jgi:glycosyltransferase involved in cell wall biosynthesis